MNSNDYKGEIPYAMPIYEQNPHQYENPFALSNYVAYPSISNYQYNNYDNLTQQSNKTNQQQQYNNSYNQVLNDYADQQYYNQQINKQIKYKNKMQSQLKWNTTKKSTPYSKSSNNSGMLYCELCKISCAGEQSYKEHCDGQKHKKKANLNKHSKQLNSSFFCDICQVSCSSLESFNAHLIGKSHIKVCNLQVKLGKEVPNELVAPIMKPDDNLNYHNNNGNSPSINSLLNNNNSNTNGNNLKTNSTSITENIIKVIGTPSINFVKGGSLQTMTNQEEEEKSSIENNNQIELNNKNNNSSISSINNTSTLSINTQTPNTVTDSKITTNIENNDKTFKSTQPNSDEQIPLLNESITSNNNSSLISNVEPIGLEYIFEYKLPNSKATYFNCELCDCKFSEKTAKEQHVRGKRHYKNYNNENKRSNAKKNQFPNKTIINNHDIIEIPYELKNQSLQNEMFNQIGLISDREQCQMEEINQNLDNQFISNLNISYLDEIQFSIDDFQSLDEKYLFKKHSEIVPREKDLKFYYEKIGIVERSLKQVSDEILNNSEIFNEMIKLPSDYNERLLLGELRVGLFGKKLLLDGENQIDLILICSVKPNVSLLKKLTELLSAKLILLDNSLKVEENIPFASIDIHAENAIIRLTLTSLSFRDINLPLNENHILPPDPEDILDKDKCLNALTELRRFKWYQAKVAPFNPCPMLIRILRDLTRRVDAWKPLTSWSIELMIEKIFSNCLNRPTISEAFKYFFQALASGIILINPENVNNVILPDPCEIGCVDALAFLSDKQRLDITNSAQKLVQFIAFNKIHEVLNTEIIKLDDVNKIIPKKTNELKNELEKDKPDKNNESVIEIANQSVVEITNNQSVVDDSSISILK